MANVKAKRVLALSLVFVVLAASLAFVCARFFDDTRKKTEKDMIEMIPRLTEIDHKIEEQYNGYPPFLCDVYWEDLWHPAVMLWPGYEDQNPEQQLRDLLGLRDLRFRYVMYDMDYLKTLEAMFRDYSYHPPENDPYHIERVRADEQLNRVFLYSYDWTKRTIRQFREQFGVFSEAVIFDWGPYDNYAIE